MAINDELEAQILRYHFVEHWRVGTIASQLGVHHYTVERVLSEAGVERDGQRRRRASKLDPYMALIAETLERFPTLTAARLFDMVKARGYLTPRTANSNRWIPSQPIASWTTPCNSRSDTDSGTRTRHQIIGLIPSSRTLSCRIASGDTAGFTDSMTENYALLGGSIKIDPTDFDTSLHLRLASLYPLRWGDRKDEHRKQRHTAKRIRPPVPRSLFQQRHDALAHGLFIPAHDLS